MLCGPYLDAADVTHCDPATPRLDEALAVTSQWMYVATGRQFPGRCTDVVRPCSGGHAVQMLDYPASAGGGSRPIGWIGGACGCGGDGIVCGCTYHDAVVLPGYPVSAINEVLIDGDALASGDVVIVDNRSVIRADGGHWPCCQNLAAPTTEAGTWSIEYEWGQAAPVDVVLGAQVLACELASGWAGGDCVLPKRLTSLTYEGATMAVLDPFQFLTDGRFGVYEADVAVAMHNPGRLDRTRTAVTARDYLTSPHRTR